MKSALKSLKLVFKSAFATLMLSCAASEICGQDFIVLALIKEGIDFLLSPDIFAGEVIRQSAIEAFFRSDRVKSFITVTVCLCSLAFTIRRALWWLILSLLSIFKPRTKHQDLPTSQYNTAVFLDENLGITEKQQANTSGSDKQL